MDSHGKLGLPSLKGQYFVWLAPIARSYGDAINPNPCSWNVSLRDDLLYALPNGSPSPGGEGRGEGEPFSNCIDWD
jgi:hypothetical protein